MFGRRKVQEEEAAPRPRLHVFGVEGDDLTGQMAACVAETPIEQRQAEDKAKASVSAFVELRCVGQTMRTTTQAHDIDPVWADASFFFGGDDEHDVIPDDENGGHSVECIVYTTGLVRPREIGRATLAFDGEARNVEGWSNRGCLSAILAAPPPPPSAPEPPPPADLVSGKLKGMARWVHLKAPPAPRGRSASASSSSSAAAGSVLTDGSAGDEPYIGRVRLCMQMVDYDGPEDTEAGMRPVQLRVKVLRGRGLGDSGGAGGAGTGRAEAEVNPLVRLVAPNGKQLTTRTLQRTAEPEWGTREEFLFPAQSGQGRVTLQVQSAGTISLPRTLGTVVLEPRHFTVLPAVLLHSRVAAQDERVEKAARARAKARAAEAGSPSAKGPAKGAAAAAASGAAQPVPRRGSSSSSAASGPGGSPDPTQLLVPPLAAMGVVGAPSPDGVLDGLPVYADPVEGWFALRPADGEDDGEYRGEVQLAVSWELPPEGTTRGPDVARRVAFDGESDPGDMRPGGTKDGDVGRVGGRSTGEPIAEEERAKQEEEDRKREVLESMELQDGDYRVLVHVIQAKDLHPEDPNGTADPCVFAEVLGKKQNSKTMWGRTSCYFDHVMWFDFKGLSKQEIETATVRIAVFDVDMITSNDLIGEFSLDAGFVYFRENHEIHNQWIGISDPTSAEKEGVQGFLKISVAVLGPHDKRRAWDPRDEEREAAEDDDKGITAKLLMPPAVDRRMEFLVVSAHLAEHLPALDAPQLFGLIQGGIDAFVQVDFGGGVPGRTLRVTRKGQSGELDPSWSTQNELWIPVLCPTMSTRVRVTLWDEDFALFGNQLCSTVFLDYARVRRRAVVRKWFNLYGANAFASGKEADRMNEYPDVGSTYRGRLLLSARVVTDEKEMEGHDEAIHALDAPRVMRALRPPTSRYELRALIISGSEIPQRTALLGAIAEGLGLSARDVGVEVRIGPFVLMSSSQKPKHRSAYWGELLGLGQSVELPSDVDQIPDVSVALFRGSGSRRVPISFKRFRAKDMLEAGFSRPASWIHLDEDASLNAVPSDEQPGSILARLAFGTVDAAAGVDDWEGEVEEASLTAPYAVRVHVYQARELPATDANGSTDPWARVQVGGYTARTPTLKQTTCPLWYSPLELRMDLPQRVDFFPELLVQMWDERLFRSVKVSQLRVTLSDPAVPKHRFASSGATDLPDGLPRPKWLSLTARNRESEGDQGQILVGVQLIALDRIDAVLPPIPTLRPRCADYFVEVVAMGLRDLKPYMGFPIYDPCVEFDVGDRKASGGIKATKHSKRPSGTNPNFGERILLPIKLPLDPIYAPSLNLTIRDRRLGGWSTPIVATTSVPLADKYPRADGSPAPVVGSVVAEDPHLNSLEEGETGPDAARMAVKAAAKRQQRVAETRKRRKLRKKAVRRQAEHAGSDGASTFASSLTGSGAESTEAGSGSGERDALLGGGSGSEDGATDPGSAGSGVQSVMGQSAAYQMSQADRSVMLPPDEDAEMSSDVDDVSSDSDDPDAAAMHLRSRRTGRVKKRAAGSVTDEAALLLRRHKTGTAGSVRSGGRRSVRASALAATTRDVGAGGGGRASRSGGMAVPGPADQAAAARANGAGASGAAASGAKRSSEAVHPSSAAEVVEFTVMGDEAAGVDFSVFESADKGGGLAAVARTNRDVSAEQAAGEAATDGDLSWLYRHLKRADAAEGLPAEDKAVGYLASRREYECGLEEALVTAPFETYDVRRGSALPRGSIFGFKLKSANRSVGMFKGVVRIIKDPRKTPPPVALESLLRPEQYLVRVYVLDGRDMMPVDGTSADPYLVLTLGKEKISDRANYKPKNLYPQIFKCFEIKALLPGPSRLHIAAWDYDMVTFDDFIGETVIDLEDRWFDKRWQSFGMGQQSDDRLAPRPLEDRTLFSPTFFGSCGQLRLWVDILRPADAARYPALDITPPPPRKFQFRVIVWRARDVFASERTGMNDLYARVWLEGQRPAETDTHWRAKGGKGSFNWRFKWDVELPYKFAVLNVQLWDRNVLKWNDAIAECQIDMAALFRRAQFEEKPYQIFDDLRRQAAGGVDPHTEEGDPELHKEESTSSGTESESESGSGSDSDGRASKADPAAGVAGSAAGKASVAGSRASRRSSRSEARHAAAAASAAGDDAMSEAPVDQSAVDAMDASRGRWSRVNKIKGTAEALQRAGRTASASRPREGAPGSVVGGGVPGGGEDDAGDPHEDEEAARQRHEELERAMAKARRKAESKRRKQRAKARGRIQRSPTEDAENIALDLISPEERARLLRERDPDAQKTELDTMTVKLGEDEEKAEEAEETLDSLRKLIGIHKHPKAENARWIPCMTNYQNGKYMPRKRGELLVSAELVPEDAVESVPAGRGRSEPNMNPNLPPPAGRMRFSLNPFYLGNAICGPGLFQRCMLCTCLLLIVVLFAVAGPMIGTVVEIFNLVPWPANIIIVAAIVVFCCGPTILLCIRQCIQQAVLNAIESRPDGPDSHEVLGDREEERGVEKGGVQDAVGAEAGPGGNFGRSAAEPSSATDEPDYGYMEDEERALFLRDAAIISRARGLARVEKMGFIAKPPPGPPPAASALADSKASPARPGAGDATASAAVAAGSGEGTLEAAVGAPRPQPVGAAATAPQGADEDSKPGMASP